MIKHASQVPGLGSEKNVSDVSFRELDNSVNSTTDDLFGLAKYPAKFIPQVVDFAIERSGVDRGVTDPFAGVGTVALASHLYHIDSELWDINPLMRHFQQAHQVALNSAGMSLLDVAQSIESRLRQSTESEYAISVAPDSIVYLSSWYHPEIFEIIKTWWWIVYEQSNNLEQSVILAPLIRVSNKWSYNDLQRQKLSRSKHKHQLIEAWVSSRDWRDRLLDELVHGVKDAAGRYMRRKERAPWPYNPCVRIMDIDGAKPPSGLGDIVISSPPYLRAQEYLRSSKLSLLWLGHTKDEIRQRQRLEIPYGKVLEEQKVISDTFECTLDFFDQQKDQDAINVLRSYFSNVVALLERASVNAKEMYLFVGSASLHGISIPLNEIFVEHFMQGSAWTHEGTLRDHIVGKTLFKTAVNPATGRPDERISTEQLVMLKRKG